MKQILFTVFALALASAARGALAELNVAEGTITTPDGSFTGRNFTIANGFKLELLYKPVNQGSWVAIGWDNKGRLIVPSYNSDQMFRVTIPKLGTNDPVKVEPIDTTPVGAAEGILYAFDSIYMNVNRSTTLRAGLYRLKDTNGDDKYDETRVIRNRQGDASDHGTHTLQLSPDKKWITMISGNATRMTEHDMSRVPEFWGEDNLIMRPDLSPPGFHRAPEAHILNFNEDGSHIEVWSIGMRNPVSFAYNKDNEIFVYDADEEPNMGFTSGYRPTNIIHAISGGDAGWRAGSKVHPTYYFDYFGSIAPVGSGSPVGSTFGTGAKFPARYQDAFYAGDWSFGNLWAVLLTPQGSSYKADVLPFISGSPFANSGIIVNPADGSMLIETTGTELYRVTYVGNESTEATKPDTLYAPLREIRHNLEKFHGNKPSPSAVSTAWPYLSDPDRAIRYAARVAVEWQPVATWREKALSETDPRRTIAAIAALARASGNDQYHVPPGSQPNRDKALQGRMLDALNRIDFVELPYQDKLDILRAYELVFTRLGEPEPARAQQLIARLDPYLPAKQKELNWMLSEVLIYLQAPSAAEKVMTLLRTAPTDPYFGFQEWPNPQQRQRGSPGQTGPAGKTQQGLSRQEDQIEYAQMLRVLKAGWTPQLRREYLDWFSTGPAEWTGNLGALNGLKIDAVAMIPETERAQYQDLIDKPVSAGRGGRGGAPVVAAAAAPGAAATPAAAARGGGGGGRGAAGTPGIGAPAQQLYIPWGGANRAFNDIELTELTKFDESLAKEMKAQLDASKALLDAPFATGATPALLQQRASDLAQAELNLALARAANFNKLKTALKVGPEKIPALIASITTHGGRGIFIASANQGAAAAFGTVVPSGVASPPSQPTPARGAP